MASRELHREILVGCGGALLPVLPLLPAHSAWTGEVMSERGKGKAGAKGSGGAGEERDWRELVRDHRCSSRPSDDDDGRRVEKSGRERARGRPTGLPSTNSPVMAATTSATTFVLPTSPARARTASGTPNVTKVSSTTRPASISLLSLPPPRGCSSFTRMSLCFRGNHQLLWASSARQTVAKLAWYASKPHSRQLVPRR